MRILKHISMAAMAVFASAGAVNAQWVPMPTTGIAGDNKVSNRAIQKVVDGGVEKTVMITTQGVFVYNPGSQSWSHYGTGLEGVEVTSISFGLQGNFAVSKKFKDALNNPQGGLLYKFDNSSEKWDTVDADVPNTERDLGILDNLDGGVYQYNMKGKNRVFLTDWGGADTTFGMVYSDDQGVTWNNYNILTTEDGGTGLYKEGNRVVTHSFTVDSEGRIFVAGKNFIQYSLDGGDTWISRRGTLTNSTTETIRTLYTRKYDNVEYLYVGLEAKQNEGDPAFATTPINDDLSNPWTFSLIMQELRVIQDYNEQYLFALATSQVPQLTEDNGETWSSFGANLPVSNNIVGLSRAGDSLYLTVAPTSTTAPNGIFVFNLLDLDAPKLQFQISDTKFGDPIPGAVIEFSGKTLSTNNQGMVTVYGITDSTDVTLKITKEFYKTIDTIITFNTANPIAIQMGVFTSLDSYKSIESTLYPNPASDVVYLPIGVRNVTVMSASGAPMNVPVSGRTLNISGLNPGLYIVRTSSGTYKFMKK